MTQLQHRDVATQTDMTEISVKQITVYQIQPEMVDIITEDGGCWQFAGYINNKVNVLFRRFLSERPQRFLIIQGTMEDRITLALLMMTKYAIRALPDEQVYPKLMDIASRQLWTEVKPCSITAYDCKRKLMQQKNKFPI
ncbi:uncharacterized protein [Apostichopus japonicus]|uniref:uncharacterized protein n=1 Tax=Stichopus japonicus TaxID=307972 RepID=UPI003AB5BEF4